jgi:uncharacterized membrane protein YhaH (DUF805 family)
MLDIHFYLPFCSYLALYCTALGLLISIPKFKGKGWLLWSLVINCVTMILSYIPTIFFRNLSDFSDQYDAFMFSWGLTSQLLSIVGDALLVAFVLTLKPTADAPIDRTLFSFRGRVKRQLFWIVSLTLLVVNTYAFYLISAFDLSHKSRKTGFGKAGLVVTVICLSLWFLASAWISLATQVKRWHDLDKSGWWVLINLVPVIGGIWALIQTGFFVGTAHSNRYDLRPEPDPFVPGSAPGPLSSAQSDAI